MSRNQTIDHASRAFFVTTGPHVAEIQRTAPPSKLSLRLELDTGQSITFQPAERMDDFAGYSCFRAMQGDWTVWFRSNATRGEVIVERGALTSDHGRAQRVGPYKAIVLRDDTPIAQLDIPFHDWFTRWRWPTQMDQDIEILAQSLDARLNIPIDPEIDGSDNAFEVTKYEGPFRNRHGIEDYFPTSGERGDIGFYTEWVAEYLKTGKRRELETILVHAETHAQFPNHIRLPTGRWLDFSTEQAFGYPNGITYALLDAHWNQRDKPFALVGQSDVETFFRIDVAHYPSICWVPWLVTGDIFYLEELQAAVIGHLVDQGFVRNELGLVNVAQVRATAWYLRDAIFAYLATPESAPNWLLPKSLFERCIRDTLNFLDVSWERNRKFHYQSMVFPPNHYAGNRLEFWQNDMAATVLGYARLVGLDDHFPNLQRAHERVLGNTIGRTSGLSGWPPQYCAVYDTPDAVASTATSWSEYWQEWATANDKKTPTKDRFLADRYPTFLEKCYGALAVAKRLNTQTGWTVPGLDEAYGNARTYARQMGGVATRWAFTE